MRHVCHLWSLWLYHFPQISHAISIWKHMADAIKSVMHQVLAVEDMVGIILSTFLSGVQKKNISHFTLLTGTAYLI